MFKKVFSYYYFFLLLIVVAGCEKIDDPIPEDLGTSFSLDGETEYIVEPSFNLNDTSALKAFIEDNQWEQHESPDNSNTRFITLEEFTGHTCQFCPIGTREIIRLDRDSIYGDQLIPIAIHAGTFAVPQPSDTMYFTDFRVDGGHGEVYQNQFNPGNSYPRGMVSRLGGTTKSHNVWQNDIKSIKDLPPDVKLNLITYYSDTLNALRIQINIEWLNTISGNFNVQVFLTEDHIIDWQKDATDSRVHIKNYDHRHVLRKVVNGTYGKSLSSAKDGNTESLQYITSINNEWKAKDMEAVVFIFNSNFSSFEVIQANASHVSE